MKIKERKIVFALATALMVASASALTSCGEKNGESISVIDKEINPDIRKETGEPDKEIKISYTLAGFGADWIKQAVVQFNRIFEGYGYKAVLGREDANFTTESVLSEIKYPSENDYDLYFDISENILSQLVDSSYSILKTKDKTLLAEIDDVLDSQAFDLGGYYEEGTIREHMTESNIMFGQYTTDPESRWYGKQFAMSWTRAIGGMVINTDVLHQAGYTEIPRTTDELFKMVNEVLNKKLKSQITGADVYPITWPGANATGYFAYSLLTWLAQWKGYQGYNDFFQLKPADGDILGHGYDVYDDIGIQYCFEALRNMVNPDYACNGTVTTIDHLQSEQILADGEALIAGTGDWCYNELIGCDYSPEELECIEMLPVPLLTEIADQVGLPGADRAAKDAILSLIIKGVDNDLDNAAIIADVADTLKATVTEEQVEKIKAARGVYFDLGTTHQVLIPSYSDCIDGAKLFLRFIFSKDFAENVYAEHAHAVNANTQANPTQSNYLKSLARISKKAYSNNVGFADKLSTIRMNGGIGFAFEPYAHWINIVKGMALKEDGYTGEEIYTRVKNSMKNNWDTILSASGVLE